MTDLIAYGGLFWSALLSATLLPGTSEVLLVGLVVSGRGEFPLLILSATVGNTCGSVVNWLCGRYLARFQDDRWFPVSADKMAGSSSFFRRYGLWSLLLAWAPVVGDALTVLAGMLRVPLLSFTLIVGFGKLARYLVVAGLALGWMTS